MKVVSKQCPVSTALKGRIESDQLDVEERFYKSMRRVTKASKSAAKCTLSEKCIDGEIEVYSARKDVPVKKEFVESANKLYWVKAKAERDNFRETRDPAPIDGVIRVKKFIRPATTKLADDEKSLWSQVQGVALEVTKTFEDDEDVRGKVTTRNSSAATKSSLQDNSSCGILSEVVATFDDDDDIVEVPRSIHPNDLESGSLFSLVRDISKTFDDDDIVEEKRPKTTTPSNDQESNSLFSLVREISKTFDDDDMEEYHRVQQSVHANHQEPSSASSLAREISKTFDDDEETPSRSVPYKSKSSWTAFRDLVGDFFRTFEQEN